MFATNVNSNAAYLPSDYAKRCNYARKGSCPLVLEVKQTQYQKYSRKGCRGITKHKWCLVDNLWMSEPEHCLFWFYYLYSRLHLKHKDTAFSCHFQYIYFYTFSFKRKMSKLCFFLSFSKCAVPILYVSWPVFYPLYILNRTLHVLHHFSLY